MNPSRYDEVERNVSNQSGSYQGLSPEALLTSEEDFLTIFKALPHIQTWIEPGSGHGLGPLLFAENFPSKQSVGIEFEKARYDESLRVQRIKNLTNSEFFHQDLLHYDLPLGDAYFIYMPTGMVLDRMLDQLSGLQHGFLLIAVESHGDLLPRLRKENWLESQMEIPLSSGRHYPNAVVFRKKGDPKESLHSHSFKQNFLLIEESDSASWLGESFNLEWQRGEEYLLKTPPRTIYSDQVKKILRLDEIETHFHPALELRRLGELKLQTADRLITASLRKIFVFPSFKLEISSGEQVEWSQIKKIFWENTLCFDSSSDYYYFPHVV